LRIFLPTSVGDGVYPKHSGFQFQKTVVIHVRLDVPNWMMFGAVNVRFQNRSGRNGCGVAGFWKRTLAALPSRFFDEAICLSGFLRASRKAGQSKRRVMRGDGFLLRIQQSEKFRPWNEKLSKQNAARLQFSALDEPIDTVIIHAQHIGGFRDGISQPFVLRWLFRFDGFIGSHTFAMFYHSALTGL
jgi:hypothetical protein